MRGHARLIEPGIFWWWPAWTEIHIQEVVRQTLNLPPQSLMGALEEIYDKAGELDKLLCAECRAKLSGWGVKIHNIFLSDLSDALVIRHLGGPEGGAATVLPQPEPRDAREPSY